MVNGIQSAGHPHPGEPFLAIGFPRTAFLPDTEVGRKVLKLLEAAFKQVHKFGIS
jgi:deltex-like protein